MAQIANGAWTPPATARAIRAAGRRVVAASAVPSWLRPLVAAVDGAPLPGWARRATSGASAATRRSAVLMLLGEGSEGPDLLLTGRASGLRWHAGQPAFPGGALEPGEDAVAAALREASEETGLEPGGVIPAALLPSMYLAPSGFSVDPVLAYWSRPCPVWPVDPAETERVVRVPIAELADPANRGTVVRRLTLPDAPERELRTPAFEVAGLVVWGFTAGLIDVLLEWGGWSVPWDRGRLMEPVVVPEVPQ